MKKADPRKKPLFFSSVLCGKKAFDFAPVALSLFPRTMRFVPHRILQNHYFLSFLRTSSAFSATIPGFLPSTLRASYKTAVQI
ncbi:MAG: hypothetical protein PF589_10155 [Gammaproteobacteria bacterium]|nr:hypothetical protein [Gammaproteobacteria bacterium]